MIKQLRLVLTALLFSVTFTITSCDVQWFGDLKQDLEDDTTTKFRFYSGSTEENFVTRNYKINSSVTTGDFPGTSDFKRFSDFKPGYHVENWKFIRNTDTKKTTIPGQVTVDGYRNVTRVQVDLNPYEFYATWAPNTDTPYTVQHYFQNLDLMTYSMNGNYTQTLQGTTDTRTSAYPLSVPGFSYIFINQVNINGDGSGVASIYYDRKMITISRVTFNTGGYAGATDILNLSGAYGTPVSISIPNRDAAGFYLKGWDITYDDGSTERINSTSLTYPVKDVTKAAAIWGEITAKGSVTITFDPESDASIDITGISFNSSTGKLTLTATVGGGLSISSAQWYLDGTKIFTGASGEVTFAAGLSVGYHSLMFYMMDFSGNYYTASATIQCTGTN